MRIPRSLPAAAMLLLAATAPDLALAQILELTTTRIYFQQLGRLAGTLNACSFQECPKRSDRSNSLSCGGAEWAPLAPSESIQSLSVDELEMCGATKGQIDDLVGTFRAEVKSYELFHCSMTFDEARQKYRAIVSAVEARKRTGTTCLRR